MLAYIPRRLLLMIPTIFGIMLVSFAIVQFVPGGPVERAIAQLQGTRRRLDRAFGGGGGQIGAGATAQAGGEFPRAIAARRGSIRNSSRSSRSNTASTSRPLERFWILVRDYATFNFGKSYYPRRAGAAD